jgi:chemotaxis protein histidine kinase CheA
MPVLPPQILREFLDQSEGLLDRVDHDIAEVNRTGDPSFGGGIASAFRSIRSGAAFLELSDLEAAATRAEALLKEFKADSIETARRELATLREAVESLRSGVAIDLNAAAEPAPDLEAHSASLEANGPDPVDLDAGAAFAASHVESRTFDSGSGDATPAPAVTHGPLTRPLAALLEQTRTIIANVAARTARDLHAEIRGGDVEADESICQSLHGALKVVVAHTSSHTADAADPTAPTPTINIAAESEGPNICIRVESPVSTLDSWASDPHLDAARDAVEHLLGSLTLSADGPSATSIALRVPASPACFAAMIVRAGDATCAIPAAQIDEIVSLASANITGAGAIRSIVIRGEALPLLDAARLFSQSTSGSIGRYALVLRAAGRRVALSVDRALGVQEVRIAPENAGSAPTAAPNRGWATLANGSLALVADVPAVVRSAPAADHAALAA